MSHRRSVTKKQQFTIIPAEDDSKLNAPKVKCYSAEEYKAMLEAESKRYADDWWNQQQDYFDKLRGE